MRRGKNVEKGYRAFTGKPSHMQSPWTRLKECVAMSLGIRIAWKNTLGPMADLFVQYATFPTLLIVRWS